MKAGVRTLQTALSTKLSRPHIRSQLVHGRKRRKPHKHIIAQEGQRKNFKMRRLLSNDLQESVGF